MISNTTKLQFLDACIILKKKLIMKNACTVTNEKNVVRVEVDLPFVMKQARNELATVAYIVCRIESDEQLQPIIKVRGMVQVIETCFKTSITVKFMFTDLT